MTTTPSTATRRPAAPDAACLPNEDTGRRSTRTAPSEQNCVAPVWWLERRAQNPIPSRTRPLNTPAPMVLCLKARESRSPPDPHNANTPFPQHDQRDRPRSPPHRRSASPDQPHNLGAGWSSPVARQAHNLKVTGSNPVPATKSLSTTRPFGKPGSLTRTGFSAFEAMLAKRADRGDGSDVG